MDEQAIRILKWGVRSLYLLMFLALMSAMGRIHLPISLAYMGAVILAVYMGLKIVTDEEVWFEYDLLRLGLDYILEDDVHKCT